MKDTGRFLISLAIANSAILLVFAAPNALALTKLFIQKNQKYKGREEDVKKLFVKMFKNKLVRTVIKDGKECVEITDKGKREFIDFDIDTVSIKEKKWDKKIRLVIFDIPEDKKIAREVLRDKLKQIGFIKVQRSVWAAPYECEKEIAYISSIYGIEKYTNYIIAEKADFSEYLIKKFGLK